MSEAERRWQIMLTRQAEKTLHRLSKPLLHRIDQALLALTEHPHPAESHLLAGHDNLHRLPVEEWRITYAVEAERFIVLVLEIAAKQQPERYRLEEELDEEFSPDTPPQSDQPVAPPITELRRPFFPRPGVRFGSIEDDFFHRGTSLLKRLRKEKIRLLIADHFLESRENLRKLLFGESDIEIVGMATNGEETVQMAVEQQPDVVLLDTHLPGIDGFIACERIVHQVPSAQIIMMSAWGTEDYIRQAMLAGAKEFLIKPFSGLELAVSIRRVYRSAAFQRLDDTRAASYRSNAFNDLKEHIQARLTAELNPTMDISHSDEVRQTLQEVFEQILTQENIILSRSERERLFEDSVAEILETELDETQKRTLAQWFKLFKLGNHVEISLAVANLSESLSFYDKLGFEKVDGGENPYPWAVVSDGLLHLGLHQQAFSSPTLSYFALHMLSERRDHLPKLGIVLDNLQKFQRIVGMYNSELQHKLHFMTTEFASPEGQRVLLADLASDVETTPAGRKFLSRYGTFNELSLRTEDVKAAVTFWGQLGFECLAEGDQPYPWVVISDGRIRLGFHQTPKLTKPTITYFAPDMPERLKRLRRRGIKFVAEHKDRKGYRIGAVIESPDGQRFFLFTSPRLTPHPSLALPARPAK